MANGPVVVSNAFLAASLITLAKIAAGCDNLDECDNKVYGFKPSSFITIISAISGLLAAFLLPLIGAMVDFTSRRRQVGMVTAAVMMLIQAIQIGTVQATWFPMAILQAINGFLFQALRLATFSYLPEIKRVVGEDEMPAYSSRFYVWFYGDQFLYTATVFVISTVLNAGDVKTGQIGQAVNVVMSGFFYILAFYFFTDKEPRRQLPEGSSLVSAGFKQMFSTAKGIVKYYPTTLTRFFLGVLFSRAGKI
jgi:UMF1 family MFS transporter